MEILGALQILQSRAYSTTPTLNMFIATSLRDEKGLYYLV